MSMREWWARVRGTLRRDALEREMDREMQFHLDMAAQRNVQRGMSPAAATREARLVFGSAEEFKEAGREQSRARVAENVATDVRFALRSMRRAPAFTIAALLTVALGIGASTALFTVLNAVLLRPLPVPRPDEFTYVGWSWVKGGDIPSLTDLQYEFVREHSRALAAVAAHRTEEAFIGDASTAQPVRGLRVAGDFLRVVGWAPRLGRPFAAQELETGEPVVILGDDTWRTRFGADSGIVGRRIRLAGEAHTVIGVLPPEFRFPPAPRNLGYLAPLVITVNPADEGHNTEVTGRLRAGLSEEQRVADVRALSDAFHSAYPALARAGDGFRFFTHQDVHVESSRRQALWVLFGAVSLVLLIGCANTATLLLVRAAARQREIAVRASIGASPGRVVQQLLTVGLVLSLAGAALGLGLGVVAVRSFVASAPNALPVGTDLGLDARVLAYAIGLSVLTGVVFGLVAAGPALGARLQAALLGGGRGTTPGRSRTREALVLLETAVAVVLLCGAALLGASFARLAGVDPGFEPKGIVAVRLGNLPPGYDAARRDQLVNRLLERMRAIPGVEHAAAAPNLPFERGLNFPMDTPERPDLAVGAVELRFVSPGYLATLGVPLRGGRDFNDADIAGAEPIAIVNEAFARHFWPDASSPLDRHIRVGHYKDRWINPALAYQTRVIGVAADIREIGLHRNPRPTVLLPRRADADETPLLLVRGRSRELVGTLRNAVVAEDAQLAPVVEPLSAVMSRSVAEPRFRASLIGAFAGFAVLLAGIGIYGVIASVVQQRRREIGLRIALGANAAAVATAVVRRCLINVGVGALAGLIVFAATRRVLASMLFQISPGDPLPLVAAVAVLALVAALASWIPARRAVRIDPATSLRME
jgi:putative ABC transport system permease protein